MKTYWEIPGVNKAPRVPCFAFEKYDGSNLRFHWTHKKGWCKYGTRNQLIDASHKDFGNAIELFLNTLADPLEQIIAKDKQFKGTQEFTAFCEFYGPSSFAGFHDPLEPKTLTLIDVSIHKKGTVLPKQFVDFFGHLNSAKLLYVGNLNEPFIQDIRENKYNLKEGVVCKGTLPNKSPQHSLWMCKIKTREWINKLKGHAQYAQTLKDNVVEQGLESDFKDTMLQISQSSIK